MKLQSAERCFLEPPFPSLLQLVLDRCTGSPHTFCESMVMREHTRGKMTEGEKNDEWGLSRMQIY